MGQEFSFFESPRYITHITQEGGGFTSHLLFNNGSSTDKEVVLQAYSSAGVLLMDNIRLLIDARSIQRHRAAVILPENTSYILIGGSKRVLVSVRYDTIKGSRGMSTHLHESNQAAKRYHVYPGVPSGGTHWEGAAIVNLTPVPPEGAPPVQVMPPEVSIILRDKSDQVIAIHTLTLASGAKALEVFQNIFPQLETMSASDYYYEISAEVPLGVTALMGNVATNDIASAHPAAPLEVTDLIRGDLDNLPNTEYSILDATLETEVLSIRLSYDPSCNFEPTLFWNGNFQESFPVQTRIKVGLVGQGVFCLDTIASQELEFDLDLINQAYAEANGNRLHPIVVHLLDENDQIFRSFTLNEEADPGQ